MRRRSSAWPRSSRRCARGSTGDRPSSASAGAVSEDAGQADLAAKYDRIAEKYAAAFFDELEKKPFDRARLDRFAAAVAGRGRVGDVGCGPGHVGRYLAARGVDVFGLDLSPRMVELARRRNPGIPFEQGDMLALALADASLAGIVAFYSLIHLARDTVARALGELTRVLVPGGRHQEAGVGVDLDERAARVARPRGVVAEAARPLRLGDLHRAMHEVTGEDRVPRGRAEADRDVARRVSRRRLEAEPLVHGVVGLHEGRLARLDDRHHAVGDARVLLVPPELPLLAREDVARIRERRHPAVAHAPRVPADV